jgi:tetratricopeptide (TPR) repeat protein
MTFLVAPILLSALATPAAAVRVWEATMDIPTYEEGLPDVNPPFDVFQTRRFNYPYTLRENLTDRRSVRSWRTLNLENEYLRCAVLPDLGGHLYNCVDKANGADMFYAQTALKKAQVSYRGSWVALGIEFNFPVSHSWVTVSPVDWATTRNPDGSASVWIGNVDRVYGMRWRVELTLRPGRSLLEQKVTLENPTASRHRFYWWSNAGVRVWDDSRIHYPQRFTASHGFRDVDTWPVNAAGVDLTMPGNHIYGPVSLFSHGSREPYMGVYHPRTHAGAVHYSSPMDAPAKKFWSWGADPDGLDWRKALSDDNSAYVEVQAGIFRNQETYGFLQPQESVRFREYWMPVRQIGGITRATLDAVVYLQRAADAGQLTVGVNVNRPVRGGAVRVKDGTTVVASAPLTLTPAGAYTKTFPGLEAGQRYTVEVADGAGRVLLAHTEDQFDFTPASKIKLGPQPAYEYPPAEKRTEEDFLRLGTDQELDGRLLVAWDTYQDGRKRFPGSFALQKAAGRLAVGLKRYDDALSLLGRAEERVTNDAELQHYLALAHLNLGDEGKARAEWEKAQHFRAFRPAALLELARLDARAGDHAKALAAVRDVLAVSPSATSVGAVEVALLRRGGRAAEARERLRHWRLLDPASSALRYEAHRLGAPDPGLWTHLAGDAQRVLNVAIEYMALGAWDDALDLLARRYPTGPGVYSEPGAAAPQDDPEIAYYRGYCRQKQGGSGAADFAAASKMSTRYVFPSRAESFPVFRAALEANPADATARYLLGSLYLSGGMAEAAQREWEQARRLDRRLPVLHRNLGLTLLHVRRDPKAALDVFLEGMDADPTNLDLYFGADQTMSILGRPAAERIAALSRYPDRATMPVSLAQKLALALAEGGRADEGERLFAGRFFAREEAGTNPRQVYVEVALQRALARARSGRGDEAVAIARALGRPVPDVSFTRDGMDPFLATPRAQYLLGMIEASAGHDAEAGEHWRKATEGKDSLFRAAPYAYFAARKLGGADEAAWRKRLEDSLAESEEFLARGTNFPGVVAHSQGMTLRALGREDEAKERFRRALMLPDQRLAHFLSRRALDGAEPVELGGASGAPPRIRGGSLP